MTIAFQRVMPTFREHHGDGTPGSVAYVHATDVRALHRELNESTIATTGRASRSRTGA